jgi:Flp pilus assembly protein CpaB
MKTRSIIVIACGLVAVLAGAILLVIEDDEPGRADSPSASTTDADPDADTTGEELAESVRPAEAIEVPEGTEAVAIDVPYTAGGAGSILVGDEVNVLALVNALAVDLAPPAPATVMVLERVEVLQTSLGGSATTAEAENVTVTTRRSAAPSSITYVLAVPVDDVERVVQAAGFHRLYLTLPGADADERSPDPATDADLLGGGE